MKDINKNKDWLLQHSDLIPNGLALISNSQRITFAALNGLVNNAVQIFQSSGIKKEKHCAVISNNNAEFIISVLALWRIGAVPVPLNIRLTKKNLEEQINFTECGFIIIHKELLSNCEFKNHKIIEIPLGNTILPAEINYKDDFTESGTSLMLFTSGSTNKPKAVVFSFKNLINSAVQTNKLISADGKDAWLASLPFYHIGGFMIFVRALINGIPIIIPDSLTHEDVIDSVLKHNPSFISFVPTQLLKVINENISPNKNLKAVLIGGGPVENNLIISANEKGWKIIKVYGSTETCSMVSALDCRNKIVKIESAGKPLQENSISINGEDKGEIVVESNSVAKCYYKDPNEKLLNGKFYSNDFGFIDEYGYLFIEGRIDDIIISGGENINAKEITNALLENSNIGDAFTLGIKDDKWGQAVVSIVVSKDKSINEEKLKKYLRSRIASFKIPKKIFFVEEIPKTELGKVRKEELLKQLNLY